MIGIRFVAWLVFLAALIGAIACDLSDTDVRETRIERIFITDVQGKRWDVTQAVARYGFEADRFRFGFGAFAVFPLVLPRVAAPGDSGYPAPDETFDVIGTVGGAEARAYRVDDLLGFEIVDDVVDGKPIAVVYRPLLGTSSVHTRVAAGVPLTLSASGWVYHNQSVLYDYETESLWYRLPGETRLTCVAGPLFQTTLAEHSSTLQPWNDWRSAHTAAGFMLRP